MAGVLSPAGTKRFSGLLGTAFPPGTGTPAIFHGGDTAPSRGVRALVRAPSPLYRIKAKKLVFMPTCTG